MPETTEISITKQWDDAEDQDGIRPGAEEFATKLSLLADGEEVTGYEPEVTDNEDGTYTVKYSGLPRIAEDREIVYSVKEDMINGYAAEPDEAEDGGTIVNKHIPAVTTLTVKKVWNDAEDQDGIYFNGCWSFVISLLKHVDPVSHYYRRSSHKYAFS